MTKTWTARAAAYSCMGCCSVLFSRKSLSEVAGLKSSPTLSPSSISWNRLHSTMERTSSPSYTPSGPLPSREGYLFGNSGPLQRSTRPFTYVMLDPSPPPPLLSKVDSSSSLQLQPPTWISSWILLPPTIIILADKGFLFLFLFTDEGFYSPISLW